MKDQKYKILVLSDLKDNTDNILKSTISLSQTINADIEFFHVKKPTEIVERESQLSAMRTINKEHVLMDKKLNNLLKTVTKNHEVKIKHKFTFGNVKSEISEQIKESKPDIIVMGKKKSRLSIIGDNVTDFIFKNHKGAVMIAGSNNNLEPNKELSLGVLNNSEGSEFTKHLLSKTSKSLKSFKIIGKSDNAEVKTSVSNQKTIEYVFDKGDNAIKNLSKYLTRSNVNLLCLDRGEKSNNDKSISLSSEIKNLIKTVDVSLLLN